MSRGRPSPLVPVLAFGAAAFVVACLSLLDMFLPRPYDGVVLDLDRGDLQVRAVVPGTGAARAGLQAGDRILGVGRLVVRTSSDVALVLRRHDATEVVNYLIQRGDELLELPVQLGPRRLATPLYLYASFSGFLFFFMGLYVLLRRPDAERGSPGQVFFILCTLFLLFLVCRLRPASYSWVDAVVLTTGTLSLLALPAAFLHFFLVFPRRLRLRLVPEGEDASSGPWRALKAVERFFNHSPRLFTILYLLPPLLYAANLVLVPLLGLTVRPISGAPLASWVLMGDYLVLGLLALLGSMLQAREGRERRQIATVFIGTVLGVTPFLVLGVVFPSLFQNDRYLLPGVVPLVLVPLTFGYAIVRFQFFDIRVIVRRSLLYTLTTAVVSGSYAVGIAAFGFLFRDASLGRSPLFPLVLALAIVALFDPLRRRLQEPVDRFFFREVYDARRAMEEVSEAVVRELSLDRLEALLTGRLAEVMQLEWAALYRREDDRFGSTTVPPPLPLHLPTGSLLLAELARTGQPERLGTLEPLRSLDPECHRLLGDLEAAGTRLLVPLRTREKLHGVLLLGGKRSEEDLSGEDLQVIRTFANQGAVALENASLYRERTRQVELEKELEIARQVQFSLIPERLPAPEGWQVAARCVPARQVGGDFYDALPSPSGGGVALVLGDVSGKSVPGAMLMVAAREILHTAALRGASPEELLEVANVRLYTPQPRLFVSLAYLVLHGRGRLEYCLAGQPTPLRRPATGGPVAELPSPVHRLPLGALRGVGWDRVGTSLASGDLVLLYSDGLTDARNPEGEPFGDDRIAGVLERSSAEPEAAVEALMAAVSAFTQSASPFDDMTVMAVRWTGGA